MRKYPETPEPKSCHKRRKATKFEQNTNRINPEKFCTKAYPVKLANG